MINLGPKKNNYNMCTTKPQTLVSERIKGKS